MTVLPVVTIHEYLLYYFLNVFSDTNSFVHGVAAV